ncbi:MAG: DNA methyltransferase [Bacteroidetes bacterium QH_8_67_23]|nr:MAG: DNA methyltransferase [Bacteroidetes bacterium QH_8_67_23]
MPATLFGEAELELPNVATVPQYSPFRYPGGKSRWYNFVKQWGLAKQPQTFVEPFAGGAHAGLAAAIEGLVKNVVLVELDENVAAVWQTILGEDADWLLERISSFAMSGENADEALRLRDRSRRDRAFAVIVHNRISRGGITAPGAGRVKQGENGKGLQSRWYPDTLIERIERIAEAAERIDFICGDGFEVAERYLGRPDVALFIDPPYPRAGGRLYEHSDVDHERVFSMAAASEGTVLLTYDDSDEVERLAAAHDLDQEYLVVSTTHHRNKKELLIGKDLSWLRGL